jgi:hypothetical protein
MSYLGGEVPGQIAVVIVMIPFANIGYVPDAHNVPCTCNYI